MYHHHDPLNYTMTMTASVPWCTSQHHHTPPVSIRSASFSSTLTDTGDNGGVDQNSPCLTPLFAAPSTFVLTIRVTRRAGGAARNRPPPTPPTPVLARVCNKVYYARCSTNFKAPSYPAIARPPHRNSPTLGATLKTARSGVARLGSRDGRGSKTR
ncbi:hypothetical protein BDV95DRAFT_354176 [Massariosphaeria phaeospora]|uniref:Uncharacterized protein n=1 Tax=Massariosphaeria phaeospora TaxID=100035 RepID=A0A7C8MCV4_9PLEO|nr:hypothetical protein BDV95DRAFT_354176 [Massariosphaeria phaeospora]